MQYYVSKTIQGEFKSIVDKVTELLSEEGFGIARLALEARADHAQVAAVRAEALAHGLQPDLAQVLAGDDVLGGPDGSDRSDGGGHLLYLDAVWMMPG